MTSILWCFWKSPSEDWGMLTLDINDVRIGQLKMSLERWATLKLSLQTPYNTKSRMTIEEYNLQGPVALAENQTKPTKKGS